MTPGPGWPNGPAERAAPYQDNDFLVLLKQAGFSQAELVAETGFKSSPVTLGALFRTVKAAEVAGQPDREPVDAEIATPTPESCPAPGST